MKYWLVAGHLRTLYAQHIPIGFHSRSRTEAPKWQCVCVSVLRSVNLLFLLRGWSPSGSSRRSWASPGSWHRGWTRLYQPYSAIITHLWTKLTAQLRSRLIGQQRLDKQTCPERPERRKRKRYKVSFFLFPVGWINFSSERKKKKEKSVGEVYPGCELCRRTDSPCVWGGRDPGRGADSGALAFTFPGGSCCWHRRDGLLPWRIQGLLGNSCRTCCKSDSLSTHQHHRLCIKLYMINTGG